MTVLAKELSRIDIVMTASHCKKHEADKGEPCWKLPIRNGSDVGFAVCGARVKRAGFNDGVRVVNHQTPSDNFN